MMDEDDMADAIAWHLNEIDSWTAKFGGLSEIYFTNEDGEKFVLRVEKVEEFP